MDILYREGRAAAGEVLERLPDPPGYSAVRAMLRVLENKGHLTHVLEDGRYVYRPIVPRNRASRSALQNLLQTFFDGSAEKAVAALLLGIEESAERGRARAALPPHRRRPQGGPLT